MSTFTVSDATFTATYNGKPRTFKVVQVVNENTVRVQQTDGSFRCYSIDKLSDVRKA